MGSDEKDGNAGQESVDLSSLQDLTFGPDWARRQPGIHQHEPAAGPRFQDQNPRARRMNDRRGGGSRGGRREAAEARPRPRRPESTVGSSGMSRGAGTSPGTRSYAPALPRVRIAFLPTQRYLSSLARRIQGSKQAVPLFEAARDCLSRPEHCAVKVETYSDGELTSLYQCQRCKMVATSDDLMVSHLLRVHLDDFFERKETTEDAPAGVFTCVAKCGLSGDLLGPPNHHSYNEKVQQIRRLRFPHMSMEDYRASIQTVHDEGLIDQWRTGAAHVTQYRRKGDDSAEWLSWGQVELCVVRDIVPNAVTETSRVVMPVDLALRMEDRPLLKALGEASKRESRSPRSVLVALRPALRHKGMHFFRGPDGQEFVTGIVPDPLDVDTAVDSIREIHLWLHGNPGATKGAVAAALRPECPSDSEDVRGVLSQLSWLIEKGHIIEFSDGTLILPRAGRRQSPEPASDHG